MKRVLYCASCVAIATTTACVDAQDYPAKAIRIVTGSAGSNVDISSRFIAQGISPALGQPVIVENRAGAVVGAELVSKAPPDGYTVLLTGGSFWIGPLMRDKTPYDAVRDFSPVALVASAPAVLVVHPTLPVKSVSELVALAKARPGELNYAGGGTGGIAHLAAELFNAKARVKMVRVSYSADALQVADLLSGQVQLSFANTGVVPHIKAHRLKALGVTSAQASPLYPGMPPIATTVPGYVALSTTAMFAPTRTPPAPINRLNQEIVRFLGLPATRDYFLTGGLEAAGSSPQGLASLMKSDIETLGKVIRDAGIRAN